MLLPKNRYISSEKGVDMRYLSLFGIVAAIILVNLAGGTETLVVGHQESGDAADVLRWTVVGAVIVFVFYWIKFNEWAGNGQSPPGFRPRPVRHFTTWVRYLGWNSLYGLVMVGAYSALVFFPDVIIRFSQSFDNVTKILNLGEVLSLLKLDADHLPSTVELVPGAVMFITAVWAGMPPFSHFEKRIRLRWQENAAIPSQARQLVEAFREDVEGENNFAPDPKTVGEVIRQLEGQPLETEDFSDSGKSIWFLYARVNYLYFMLEKQNRSPLFSRLADRYGDEFKDLEKNMVQLRKQVLQRISDIQDLCDHELDPQFRENSPALQENREAGNLKGKLRNDERWLDSYLLQASKAEKAYFQRQKEELLRALDDVSQDIIQLIVCGVLAVGRSLTQRSDLLASFGLKNTDRIIIQLDSVTLTWIALSASGVVFICSTIYFFLEKALGQQGGPIPVNMSQVFQWSVFACLMHLTAIGGSYVVQRSLENDRDSIKYNKPKLLSPRAQVAEAVWAAVFGISINVYLLGLFTSLNGRFSSLEHVWWWAAIPGVTAFFAALYTQNVQRSDRELKNLLWWQSLATGSMAFVVFIIIHFNNLYVVDVAGTTFDWNYVVFGIYAVVTNMILGRALGKTLYIWVVAERYTGFANRRSNTRRNYFFKRAKWRSDAGEMLVRAVSVSSSGAELKTPEPLSVNSTGQFVLSNRKIRQAIVLRNHQEDLRRSFVKFVEEGS